MRRLLYNGYHAVIVCQDQLLRCDLQGVRTASELALQLRKLDGHIQWETLKRPIMDTDNPFASAEVLERRPGPAPSMGWEYLVQMAPAEIPSGVGFGGTSGIRQPLQPLTAVPGQMSQAQQQQQQLMSKQKLPAQLLGQTQGSQHALQQQQQQQRAYTAGEDRPTGVQQTMSGFQLPQQLPAIAEPASRPDASAVPKQAQAGMQNDVAATKASHIADASVSVPSDASKSPGPHVANTHLQGMSDANGTLFVPSGAEMSNGDQHLNGIQPGLVDSKLSQRAQVSLRPRLNVNGINFQPSASPSPQRPHPTPTPTPFLTQQLPKQANSLSSLIPSKQQHPPLPSSSAQASAQPLGPFRPQGQPPAAGPSREGTPMPRAPPSWLHESQLPLWLVRTFEEKRRRDVAMVAARAAQQAQREANAANRGLGSLAHSWRSDCKLLLHYLVQVPVLCWDIHFYVQPSAYL